MLQHGGGGACCRCRVSASLCVNAVGLKREGVEAKVWGGWAMAKGSFVRCVLEGGRACKHAHTHARKQGRDLFTGNCVVHHKAAAALPKGVWHWGCRLGRWLGAATGRAAQETGKAHAWSLLPAFKRGWHSKKSQACKGQDEETGAAHLQEQEHGAARSEAIRRREGCHPGIGSHPKAPGV